MTKLVSLIAREEPDPDIHIAIVVDIRCRKCTEIFTVKVQEGFVRSTITKGLTIADWAVVRKHAEDAFDADHKCWAERDNREDFYQWEKARKSPESRDDFLAPGKVSLAHKSLDDYDTMEPGKVTPLPSVVPLDPRDIMPSREDVEKAYRYKIGIAPHSCATCGGVGYVDGYVGREYKGAECKDCKGTGSV